MKDNTSKWQHVPPKVNDQTRNITRRKKEKSHYKSNQDQVQPKVNNQRAETLQEEKRNQNLNTKMTFTVLLQMNL